MNKMVMAGLAAGGAFLTALASQRASAQCCRRRSAAKRSPSTSASPLGFHCHTEERSLGPGLSSPCCPYPPPPATPANQFPAAMPAPDRRPEPAAAKGRPAPVQNVGYNYPGLRL